MLDALGASHPNPELAEQMHLFGQFIGSWDIEVATLEPDGSWRQEQGEWHFGWILEGRALQDVWITPERGHRQPEGVPPEEYGAAIRFYDRTGDHWRSVWIGPILGKLRTFDVQVNGDEIELVGTDDRGMPMHWVFSDITNRAFRWRSQITEDDGESWRIVQTMKAKRRTSTNNSTPS